MGTVHGPSQGVPRIRCGYCELRRLVDVSGISNSAFFLFCWCILYLKTRERNRIFESTGFAVARD